MADEHNIGRMRSVDRKIVSSKSASLVLLSVAILGIASSIMALSETTPPLVLREYVKVSIAGYVYDENGKPLPNATVEVLNTQLKAMSDPNGYYCISNASTGVLEVRALYPNRTTVIKRIVAHGDQPVVLDFCLKNGSGMEYVDLTGGGRTGGGRINTLFGLISLVASASAALASYLSYKGINFRLTTLLATVSIMSYGFIVGSLLAFAALILILASRSDFQKVGR
ncbi:MAG: hypothetical protein DRN20_05245 [Thermoplasmata archaeon]|mgnify:CR=1 FL=1|nr:MAG: hypothetical protein DRN20_05245 [Thermoplasmata archaeon]